MISTTRAIILGAVAGGGACLYAALRVPSTAAGLSPSQWVIASAVGALILENWIRPFVLFRDGQSSGFQLDEGFFVILAMTLPPYAVLATMAGATAFAQLVRRRALLKSAFNVGSVLISSGLGLAASRAIDVPSTHARFLPIAALLVGVVVYFGVNTGLLAAVMLSLGSSRQAAVLGDLRAQGALAGVGYLVGTMMALAVWSTVWALVVIVPSVIVLKGLVTARFSAQRDRARVQGLFEATMESHRILSREAVDGTILAFTSRLLRSPESYIGSAEPESGLAAPITTNGQVKWLVAAGRKREEPFEDHDRSLLEALAAIASGASSNADLYRQVRYERQRLSSIALSIGEAVVAVDLDGHLTFANRAASELVSLPAASVMVDDQMDVDALRAPDFLLSPARRCIEQRRLVRDENAIFPTVTGASIPVAYTASPILDGGNPVGAVIAFRDMTERKLLEDELRHQALHDSLTGLANRRLMVDRLERLLTDPTTREQTHAVVFIDVDRFKGVNDSLGHAMGDDLLVWVSRRLQASCRPGDLLARFGGDEFVALLQDVGNADEAIAAAHRMGAAVEEPTVLADGYELVATVSVGVALSEPGQTADDLLHDADVAMYHTKVRNHGGSVQLFDRSSMNSRSAVRVQLEADLRRAVERGEIEVHYQPLCSIDDGAVVGAEALVRWRHPELGLLQPAGFVGLAEETGLIIPVGLHVLEQAAEQARVIEEMVGVAMPISVNLSPRQFHHMSLITDIRRIIRDARIEPSSITVEITESMVMDDMAKARELIGQLRMAGVSIAMDDFGTGHSSLGYLKQFPIQELKIDRSFVIDVARNRIDRAIVRAVVELADAMQVIPVAEGIETVEQLEALRSLGCRIGQGYYFSRPLPSDEFLALLRQAPPLSKPHPDRRFMARIVTSS